MAVEILAANIPASPPGNELAGAAVRSLDPHQVKFVEACWRGYAATGDPAFAVSAHWSTTSPPRKCGGIKRTAAAPDRRARWLRQNPSPTSAG